MTEEDEEFNRIEREAAMRKEAVRSTVARREWVGLTDEDYQELHLKMEPTYFYQDYGRAIEALLKEKNT